MAYVICVSVGWNEQSVKQLLKLYTGAQYLLEISLRPSKPFEAVGWVNPAVVKPINMFHVQWMIYRQSRVEQCLLALEIRWQNPFEYLIGILVQISNWLYDRMRFLILVINNLITRNGNTNRDLLTIMALIQRCILCNISRMILQFFRIRLFIKITRLEKLFLYFFVHFYNK